ncbi:hypothetical protein O6P43_023616 [Quillaja saponaria]|uniref:Uncharacterized protein n=1 Tax=Quillaja saponaria TaxID=32244 RepID=A0AAD7LG74_QUISA|nr:hypothetical protein O6P43_023616 [Quillaja saponaria]
MWLDDVSVTWQIWSIFNISFENATSFHLLFGGELPCSTLAAAGLSFSVGRHGSKEQVWCSSPCHESSNSCSSRDKFHFLPQHFGGYVAAPTSFHSSINRDSHLILILAAAGWAIKGEN